MPAEHQAGGGEIQVHVTVCPPSPSPATACLTDGCDASISPTGAPSPGPWATRSTTRRAAGGALQAGLGPGEQADGFGPPGTARAMETRGMCAEMSTKALLRVC